MDPDKIEAINRVHVTKHLASIRSFLGMTGFYRRWILGYAHITAPLAGLLQKGIVIPDVWTSAHDEAIIELKKRMSTFPVLRMPDPTRPYVIISDACQDPGAIGGALCQRFEDRLQPIAYCSRLLRSVENMKRTT